MRKKKFDGSISEIMVAYQPNQELDFGPVRKMARDKRLRYMAQAQRAVASFQHWLDETSL